MRDDLDNDLLQLFEEKNLELPDYPFRAEFRRRIDKTRIGHSRMYWLLTALALAVCISLTSLVIDVVTLFCGELTRVLQSAVVIFTNPVGLSITAVVVLLSPVFYRRVISMFY